MSLRPYETMVVLDANLGDADIEKEIDKIKQFVTTGGGEVGEVDLWGRRKLAYEIEGRKEGYYAIIKFKAEPTIVLPLNKAYRLNEQVLRHMVVVDDLKAPLGSPDRAHRGDDDDEDGGRDFGGRDFGGGRDRDFGGRDFGGRDYRGRED